MAAARTLRELREIRADLLKFKVLDPACGSGNFLYVAYRELKRFELDLLERVHAEFAEESRLLVGSEANLSVRQFYGIDKEPFAVELAKVTMMLARQLALTEVHSRVDAAQGALPLEFGASLPLENLKENIKKDDALFCKWESVNAIVGNPPYQSKNKMVHEFGREYVDQVRAKYPRVPGRADYCVYWFRRAHDELPAGGRAGLVGTNTIRQNFSRIGRLDYIVANGGSITEAVSTQVWPGDAVVHVSVVNWIKGQAPRGKRRLFSQPGTTLMLLGNGMTWL